MFAGIFPNGVPDSLPEIAHINTDFPIPFFPTNPYFDPNPIDNDELFNNTFPGTCNVKFSILMSFDLSLFLLENDVPFKKT